MVYLMKCPGCGRDAPWFMVAGVVCLCGYEDAATDAALARDRRLRAIDEKRSFGHQEQDPVSLSVQVEERVNAGEKLGG